MELTDNLYKKIKRARKLSLEQTKICNIIGKFLESIHPNLEEEMRDGHSFLDEMMDYGNGFYTKKEIGTQIKNALVKVQKR